MATYHSINGTCKGMCRILAGEITVSFCIINACTISRFCSLKPDNSGDPNTGHPKSGPIQLVRYSYPHCLSVFHKTLYSRDYKLLEISMFQQIGSLKDVQSRAKKY